jgi:hypothetical protein
MTNPKPQPSAIDRFAPRDARLLGPGRPVVIDLDWPRWLRSVERKRRLLLRDSRSHAMPTAPDLLLRRITLASFQLEGIPASESEIEQALPHAPGHARRRFHSRQQQRFRGHVAILLRIGKSLRQGEPLKTGAVLRWYTMLSAGLCTEMLADQKLARLDQFCRRINSPHLRLQPALQEIARTHVDALADELVPSFHGIIARLLLTYHLGRCGLPPIAFEPQHDIRPGTLLDENRLLARLMTLIEQSFDLYLDHAKADTTPAHLNGNGNGHASGNGNGHHHGNGHAKSNGH